MKSFTDSYLNRIVISPDMLSLISAISEFKGREDLYKGRRKRKDILEKLVAQAKVESVESSNRIEGVDVKHDRVADIVERQSSPRNRPEEEVAGYRDALAYIHENFKAIPVSLNSVTLFHQFLYKHTNQPGGEFKWEDNLIVDRLPDGTERVRFTPPPASQTYLYVENLVSSYQYILRQRNYSPLILIPLFILDYLCIHPFQDGNGRTARLWALLLLYQAGYTVGKYISLERIIEESKETYYESLERSSQGWHEEKHDPKPWLRYFYGTLIRAYKEFETRASAVREDLSKTQQVKDFIARAILPFSIGDIQKEFPMISKGMIRRVIRELRDADKISATGKGRGAKWYKKSAV